ncbi:hypothetical protein GOV04_05625 [Candidatus Woesearchaeota archaeon]|nr:hypothetical protein [Candidatus Woesearchaeota archaeon]
MKKFFFILFLTIFLSSQTQALGVAQDYLKDNTLRLLQGQEHVLKLTLQNPQEEPVTVTLVINSEIATIINPNQTYNLPAKSFDTEIFLKIKAPKDAQIGDAHKIIYSITPQAKDNNGGMIGMNMRLTRSFDVLIVDENGVGTKPKKLNYYYLSFTIVLFFVIFLLWKRSNIISKKLFRKK